MNIPKRISWAGLGAIIILASLFALAYFKDFQSVLLIGDLLQKTHPLGVLTIFGLLIFSGIYLFNTAGKIIKEAVK